MNENRYGDSDASKTLVKMLAEKPEFQTWVGRRWVDYSTTINQIVDAENMDRSVKINVGTLFHDHSIDHVKKGSVDPEIKTYLQNIIVAKWRKIQKSLS